MNDNVDISDKKKDVNKPPKNDVNVLLTFDNHSVPVNISSKKGSNITIIKDVGIP